jgi:hypothetical protein
MPDILDTIGRIALGFQSAPQGVPGRILDELRPWFARLAVNAAPKWLPRLAYGFPCSVPVYRNGEPVHACPGSAVASCDVCGEPCCLDHARIDQYGDAICYLCVVEAVRAKRAGARASRAEQQGPPPPGPAPTSEKELAWARKLLAVKKDADWEEIRAAHRKLSAKWHPDKFSTKGPAAYAKAEQTFKEVQRAFDVLGRQQNDKKKAA